MQSSKAKWYLKHGIDDDIVISSKLIFKRNLYDFNFPPKMTDQDAMRVIEEVAQAFFSGRELMARRYQFIRLDKLEDKGRLFWVQRLIVDPEALKPKLPEALILSEDESASIWINHQDHVHVQVMNRGFQIGRIYEIGRELDDALSDRLLYAYSQKYGYLTTAASDMGTGMQLSFYMHLPFCENTGVIQELAQSIAAYGYEICIVQDIPSRSAGHIYEVTNSKTLGVTEKDILDGAAEAVDILVKKERELKAMSLLKYKEDYIDNIYKAYGILRFARKLSIEDAMEYLSFIDQGVNDKTLKFNETFDVFPILIDIQPENLTKIYGNSLAPAELDMLRALYIQERLPEMNMED